MKRLTEEQFQIIYDQFSYELYKIAYGYLHNRQDAEDVIQNVFMKLLENIGHIKDDDHLKFWLIRVDINESLNMLKTKKRMAVSDEINPADVENKQFDFDYYLDGLSPKDKEIIILYYFEDLKVKECAKYLNINEEACKKRLIRARASLKELMEGGNEHE